MPYSKNLKQFHVVKSLSFEMAANYQKEITAKFRELVSITFGSTVTPVTNYYTDLQNGNNRARFTLLFPSLQKEHEVVMSILNQLAIASVASASVLLKQKEAEEATNKAVSEHEVYKQHRIESLRSAIAFLRK